MDVSVQPDAPGVTLWGNPTDDSWVRREILGTWAGMPRRRSPAEVDRAIRENPAPRQDPGAQVQAAARQAEALRGVSAKMLIVDEVSEIGSKPKKSDQERPDRFMLIELD